MDMQWVESEQGEQGLRLQGGRLHSAYGWPPLPYLHRSHIKELSKKSSSYVLVNYFEAHNINGLVIYTLLTIVLFVKQMHSTQMFQ